MGNARSRSDVIVIGSGLLGLSIAYRCAEAGLDAVVLNLGPLEVTTIAQSTGIIRTYFPGKPHDSDLVLRSIGEYRSLDEDLGVFAELVDDVGFLTVLTSDAQAADLERDAVAQRAAGAELRFLTPREAVACNPWLAKSDVVGAIWCPRTYRVNPRNVVEAYLDGLHDLRATVVADVAVDGLDAQSGVVITAGHGSFHADHVVIAADSASRDVADLAQVALPLWGQYAELMQTDDVVDVGEISAPFTYHHESGLKTLGSGRGFMVGLEQIVEHSLAEHDSLRDDATDELRRRYPILGPIYLRRSWAGTLDVTRSTSAVIDRVGGHDSRIIAAAGFGGHGLGQAPAVGGIVRDLLTGGHSDIDIAPFATSAAATALTTPIS